MRPGYIYSISLAIPADDAFFNRLIIGNFYITYSITEIPW